MFADVMRRLKGELCNSLSSSDRRAKIQDSDFIIGLVQGVAGAKGNFSLAGLKQLGYWSAQRFIDIGNEKAFFLSRIKTNLKLTVTKAVYGMGKSIEGRDLLRIPIQRKRKSIVEVMVNLTFRGESTPLRVIGFWNNRDRAYRWYTTNLTCHRSFIYDAYRLRWQLELSFKAMKSTLNFDRMPTTNPNAIIALSLVSLINYVFAMVIRDIAKLHAVRKQHKSCSASIQRAVKLFASIAPTLLEVAKLCHRVTTAAMQRLNEKLLPLLEDVFDPNFKTRKTSVKSLKIARATL